MKTAFVVATVCTISSLARGETARDVLTRMDQSSSSFRGMAADIKKASYTAVIKDLSEESGKISMRLGKNREMEVRVDFTSPDQKSWAFRGRKAELFIPKINTVQEYDLGKHARLLDQFLLLGFGSRSREIDKSYEVKYLAEETLQSRKTSKIELVPKSLEARQHLTKVEIWVPLDGGTPIQQKFHQGAGDYLLVTYSGSRIEPNLPDSAVRLNLPKNVKRENPTK